MPLAAANPGTFAPVSAPARGDTVSRAAALVFAALLLCWPALYNGYPLIFPDTASYISDGREMLGAVLGTLHRPADWMRSPLYGLSIYPFHLNRTPWPIVPLHALAVAWVLWLLVRAVVPRTVLRSYLLLVAALALLTGLPWVVCWIMPDVLGPVAYLGIVLVVFARGTLSRTEAAVVVVLACWAMTAHLTHLLASAMLCVFLLLWAVLCPRMLPLRDAARALLVLGIAVAAQVAVNSVVYRHLTFSGEGRPPYLMARLIADGPARALLAERCGSDVHWTICRFQAYFSNDSDRFLWDDNGVLAHASRADIAEIDREEWPLFFATLRHYPRRQIAVSLSNFSHQLLAFDFDDFSDSPATDTELGKLMPGADRAYRGSREFHNSLPTQLFSIVQDGAVALSLLVWVAAVARFRRGLGRPLLGLAMLLPLLLLGNAALTGVLSEVDPRYAIRVVWLLPLTAGLMVFRRGELILRRFGPPQADA